MSPDGTQIAYSSCQYSTEGRTYRGRIVSGREEYHYEIATVGTDGSTPERLTENTYMDNYPAWSPDGSRIAFIRNYDYWGNYGWGLLRTMLADGSNEQDIVANPPFTLTAQTPPVWSPDSERIAFVLNEGGHIWGVYTVGADGSGLRRVSETVGVPSWSPDGHRLALAKRDGEDVALFTVATDGSDPQRITTITDRETFEAVGSRYQSWINILSWSPSGDQILFSCDAGICVATLDGVIVGRLPIKELPIDGVPGWSMAAWSPDGSRVAVRVPNNPPADSGGNPVIYTVNPDGTDLEVLVRGGSAKVSGTPGPEGITFDIASCRNLFVVPEPEKHPGLVGDCEALKVVKDVLASNIILNWGYNTPIDQ